MKKEDLYSLIEYIKTVFIMFFVFFLCGEEEKEGHTLRGKWQLSVQSVYL